MFKFYTVLSVLKISVKKRKDLIVLMEIKLEVLKRIDKGESLNKITNIFTLDKPWYLGESRGDESWCAKRLCTKSLT